MNHIEPLESRLQFAAGIVDQTFGLSGQASVDMAVPLDAGLA